MGLPISFFALCHAVIAIAVACPGQYLNRAVYLGRENEGIRSGFSQNPEYFLNRFSYLPAPWWLDLDPFGCGFEYSVGSVSSTEFTIEGRVQIREEIGRGFAAHLHALQSENQDSRFLRNGIELEYAVTDRAAIFVMVEGSVDKAEDDISVGCYLRRDAGAALRAAVTFVDLPSDKSEVTHYDQRPLGLMLSGFAGDASRAQIGFEIGSQLPLRLRELDLAREFELRRHIGSVETRFRVDDRDWLILALEGEYTEKSLRPDAILDPSFEQSRRVFFTLRTEYWRRFEGGDELSIGALYLSKNEDGYRPNDTNQTLRIEREEWYGLARGRMMLSDRWSFEPSLYAGHASVEEALGSQLPKIESSDRFEGKAGSGLVYHFGESAQMMFNLTAEIDSFKFGGGSVLFRAAF